MNVYTIERDGRTVMVHGAENKELAETLLENGHSIDEVRKKFCAYCGNKIPCNCGNQTPQ